MRKLKSLSKIIQVTGIFLLVFVMVFLVLKKIFASKGEQLKDILYKSDNLIVQALKKGNKENGDFFILKKEGLAIENIKMQESEVQAIKFVDINELIKMQEENNIVERKPVYDELINYLHRY